MLEERFHALDANHDGIVTQADADAFIAEHKKVGIISSGMNFINRMIPI